MAQELEDLLIKVDSECGDLKGIDSAIIALQNLSNFSSNATKGANSLEKMGSALSQLSAFGKSKFNSDKLVKDIDKLKGSLESLAEYTKDANKSIKQLKSLGDALGSFTDVGSNLKGINEVTKGIGKMVDILDKLSKVEKDSSKGIKNLKNLGDALHSFNGLEDNVKGLDSIASGLIQLGKATEALKGYKKGDFAYLTNLGKALNDFTGTMEARKWEFVGNATKGISDLTESLKNTKDVDVKQLGIIAEELKKFGDQDLMKNASNITGMITSLSTALNVLGQGSNNLQSTVEKLIGGFKYADEGFYNIRTSIEAVATDLEDAIKPIQNSALFDTLERFKHLNDSYKNVGGLGQGLGVLISSLEMLDGRELDVSAITQVLEYFDQLAKSNSMEEAIAKFEKIGNIAQPIASLINALKYTDFDDKNNVLSILGEQINNFYHSLPSNFEKFSYAFYSIRDLIELSKDTSTTLPEDNVLTQLGRSLEGFKGIGELKNFESLVRGIKDLVSWLHILQQEKERYDDKSSFGSAIDVTPILEVGKAITQLKDMGSNLKDFERIMNGLKGLYKIRLDNLEGIVPILDSIFALFQNIPQGSGDALKGLASSLRALEKLQDIEPQKLSVISEGLAKIFDALKGIQGSGNRISIRLDSSGVANFQRVATSAGRSWDDFSARLEEDVKHINLSDMFDMSGSVHQLKKNLDEAERMLRQRIKTIQDETTKLERTRQTRSNYEDTRDYQVQFSNIVRAKEEARQLEDIIKQINVAIAKAPRFTTDVEAMKYIHKLKEEYQSLKDTLDRFSNGGEVPTSGNFAEGLELIRERMQSIQDEIQEATDELGIMEETEEGLIYKTSEFANEMNRVADNAERASKEMRGDIGKGFSKFSSMLSGSKNKVAGSIGNLFNMFGKAVQDGTAVMSTETLTSMQGMAETLGTVATAIGQVGAIVAVVVSAMQAWWKLLNKVRDTLVQFTQSVIQFSKNMLSRVVGAFNAVAGAVGKMVSAVKSGAEAVSVALRKIGEVGRQIIDIFGKVGNAFEPAIKGIKAMLLAVTPRFVKTLSSANFQLSKIIKQSNLLKNAIKSITRYFSMLTRMLMRKSITAFLNAMKQAFEDMVLFEKNADDAFLQLNYNVSIVFSALRRLANQVVAIFEPLINAVASPIESFLTGLQTIAENVAKFMAILTGQPYYLRAKKFYEDYGQNVEDTTKKVKNLTNGLDELNILNDTSSSSSDSQISPDEMFEKVPVDGTFEGIHIQIKDILDAIKDFLKNIDWEAIKKKVREFIHRLMEIINEVLRDIELWGLIGDTLAQLFNTLMEAWNQFITDFDPVATEKALSELIVRALNGIDWDLIHENVELTAQKFAQFWNEVFADDKLWDSITTTITNLLNEIVHYFDTWAWTFDFSGMARQLTRSLTNILEGFDYEQLRHAVEGWTTGIANFINTTASDKKFWETLGTSIADTINATIIEGLAGLGQIDFTDLTDSITLSVEKALNGIDWEKFKEDVRQWGANIADIVNGFFADEEFLTSISTGIANFTNSIIGGLAQFIEDLKAYDIGNAIVNAFSTGISEVEWEKAFTLPANAINKFSEAIRGMLDALPDDFNLGTWLTDHLTITMDAIDWDTIEQNVEDLRTQISNFISGTLQNEQFWASAGTTTGKVIKIGLDLAFEFFNFNGEDLGTAISNYINNLVRNVNIGDYIVKTVDVALNLVVAVDVALRGIDWKTIGDQIGQGIVDAVNKIFKNRGKIRQMIQDAFSTFSTLVNRVLVKMVNNGSFYQIGQVVGEVILAVINGIAGFFDQNEDAILEAMKQLGDSLASFINDHKDEIVTSLNTIIDGICDLIEGFFDEKSELMEAINGVIEELHLGRLLGTILSVIIRKFTAKLKNIDAIMTAIQGDLDGLADALADALKGLGKYLLQKTWENIKEDFTDFSWIFGASEPLFNILDLLKQLFFGSSDGDSEGIDISGLFDKLKFTGLSDAWEKLKEKLTNLKNWFKEKIKGIGDFFSGLFGGKDNEIPVTIEPTIDDSSADSWDDLFDDTKKVPIELEDPTLGTITASYIDVDTINANILNVGDIFADRLHVGEIDTSGSSGLYQLGENQAGVNFGGTSGTLTKGDVRTETTGQKIAKWLSGAKDKLNLSKGTKWSDISGVSSASDLFKGISKSFIPSTWKAGKSTSNGTVKATKADVSNLNVGKATVKDGVLSDALKNVDLDSALKKIDWNKLLKGINWNKLLKNLDFNKLFDKVDWKKYAKIFREELEDGIKYLIEDIDWAKLGGIFGDAVVEKLKDAGLLADKEDNSYTLPTLNSGNEIDAEGGTLSLDDDKNILDKLYDLFPDGFLSKDDVKLIDVRLGELWQNIKDFFDDVKNIFENWNFAEAFFSKEDKEKIGNDLSALRRNIQDFLKDVKSDIQQFKEDVEKIFDDLKITFLSGLKEKAKTEMDEALKVIKEYCGLMILEFVRLKQSFNDIFEGLDAKMEETFESILVKLQEYLDKIKAKIDEFNASINIVDGMSEATELEMAEVYDVIDTWLGNIYQLLSSFSAPLSLNIATAFSSELDNAYGYVEDFVNRVQKKFDELDLNSLINGKLGDIQIKCDVKCHGDCSCCKNGSNKTYDLPTNNGSTNLNSTSGRLSDNDSTTVSSLSSNDTANNTQNSTGVKNSSVNVGSEAHSHVASTDGVTTRSGVTGNSTGKSIHRYDKLNGRDIVVYTDGSWEYVDKGSTSSSGGGVTTKSNTDVTNVGAGVFPTVDEALAEGLNNAQIATTGTKTSTTPEANKDKTTKTPETIEKVPVSELEDEDKDSDIKDSTEEEDKEEEKQGRKQIVANVDTGLTTRYDEDGNVIGTYQANGTWDGKYYRDGELVSDNVEQYRKDLNDKAKKLYDEIVNNANATSGQKSDAKRFYNGVGTASSATYADGQYRLLEELAKKVKEQKAEDLLEKQGIRIGMEGTNKAYYNPTNKNAVYSANATLKSQLASAIFKDKDTKGKKTYWYLGLSNTTTPVTDSALIQKMKDKIKSLYGITEADLPAKYQNTTSATASTAKPTTDTSSTNTSVPASDGSDIASALAERGNKAVQFMVTDFNKGTKNQGQKTLDFLPNDKFGINALASDVKKVFNNNWNVGWFKVDGKAMSSPKEAFEYWYKNSFLVKGYQMGGMPNSGELYVARENGASEFVGSFGNKSVVANNDQIVTAVANGVAMANDSLKSAIEDQTQRLETAIDRKDLDVQIGDRQIAEANRRGEQSLGQSYVN